MADSPQVDGQKKPDPAPPIGTRWKRTRHEASKGGCGADITKHCSAFTLTLPVMTPQGPGTMTQVVRVIPMLCPACDAPIFWEQDPSGLTIARGVPGPLS